MKQRPNNFHNFLDPLYKIVTSNSFDLNTNKELFDTIINITTSEGGKSMRAAALRFLSAFQPFHLSTVVATKNLWELYNIFKPFGIPNYHGHSDLELSHHLQLFINQQYPHDNQTLSYSLSLSSVLRAFPARSGKKSDLTPFNITWNPNEIPQLLANDRRSRICRPNTKAFVTA